MKNITSSSSPSPLHHYHSPQFVPIIQNSEKRRTEEEEEEEDEEEEFTDRTDAGVKHHPTPLHRHSHGGDGSKNRPESAAASVAGSVSCSKCRPHAREKFSVVPLDNNGVAKNPFSMASPNGIFKSIISSLTRRSPKSVTGAADWAAREEHWKIALGEISHKLIQATRKRDEAVLEASRLKYSMAELEKKLNKLEIYCHTLKSGLDECAANPRKSKPEVLIGDSVSEKIIANFLASVSESRSSVRQLSRSMAMQLRHTGGKVHERIQFLLQPHEIKIPQIRNPRTSILFNLEALMNRAFFEDFESVGFEKNSPNRILNPSDRTESNIAAFNLLHRLTWEEVLSRGTRHFSEEFSRFCDRKMSNIVAMLEWNRAWPEPLLQAFFAAAKSVWLVHLLATAVHPSLPIFRVDSGARFDGVYMEDIAASGSGGGGEKPKELAPATVRIMVSPGFYVFENLIKCKVLCRYHHQS